MRVYLTNLGCKLNQSELEALARQMTAHGHDIAGSLATADLHVVNTCTVTHVAARTSRKIARQGSRLNPATKTVLTGCYVNGSPAEAAALAGVDLIVPNEDKDHLLERVYERFPQWRPASRSDAIPVPYVPLSFGNTRGLVKIEDGCNMRCTFCVIPLTRGSQRSRPLPEIVHEVAQRVDGGFRELVITGVQISSYRWRGLKLFDLVRSLLDQTTVERLRLSSIAPWDFDHRLLKLVRTGRVCRHFHLSLQSGCDRILAAMRRPYSTRQFADLVATLRTAIPAVAVTTDVIIGFPGETEDDFRRSVSFVQEMEFAKIHVFPYSPRKRTSAADLPLRVGPTTMRVRMSRMLEVARASERRFQKLQLGTTVPVLWEKRQEDHWQGTSDNYLKVRASTEAELERTISRTHLDQEKAGSLWGSPLPGRAGHLGSTRRQPLIQLRVAT